MQGAITLMNKQVTNALGVFNMGLLLVLRIGIGRVLADSLLPQHGHTDHVARRFRYTLIWSKGKPKLTK